MIPLEMEYLINNFNRAKELGMKYVGVRIDMENFDAPEIIINPTENFDMKLAYYQAAYDEELRHKHAKGIRIGGFTFGNTFDDIEADLMG